MSGHAFGRNIGFIFLALALWIAISTGWYVCGINKLCIAEAHNGVTMLGAESHAPLTVAYDRAGAAGEIFVMLLVAFVLGGLLGRMLAAPRAAEVPPLSFSLPELLPQSGLNERLNTPTHVSELTKKAAAIAAAHVHEKPAAVIALPAAERPQLSPPAVSSAPSPAPSAERPKIRFNTSWSNPYRGSETK